MGIIITREKKAKTRIQLECGLDKVIEVIPTKDFVEVVGTKGGDILTYRLDNDGNITER
jgi:hypothetical protein